MRNDPLFNTEGLQGLETWTVLPFRNAPLGDNKYLPFHVTHFMWILKNPNRWYLMVNCGIYLHYLLLNSHGLGAYSTRSFVYITLSHLCDKHHLWVGTTTVCIFRTSKRRVSRLSHPASQAKWVWDLHSVTTHSSELCGKLNGACPRPLKGLALFYNKFLCCFKYRRTV